MPQPGMTCAVVPSSSSSSSVDRICRGIHPLRALTHHSLVEVVVGRDEVRDAWCG